MVDIKGVLLKLESENEHKVEKDERFYVGVCGNGKAREFQVYGYDDFNKVTDAMCRFGDVWEEDSRTNAKEPFKVSNFNEAENRLIDLDKVNRVYLRKQSHNGKGNLWTLNGAEVTLYGSKNSHKRKIYKSKDCGYAFEYGIKMWLREQY